MSERQTVMNLLNTINANIDTENNIKTKESILIAVSGGQDSICLFFIFIQLKKQWHWSFGIIYCNHLWQKNSFFSGSLILKIAYMFTVSIYYVTTTDKIFSEKDSRKWRYTIFYRILAFYNYTIISSGHTESDKIETILFQFIRGGSLKSFVPLKTVKDFSSNSKFVKKTHIKTTFIYFKKNYVFFQAAFLAQVYRTFGFVSFSYPLGPFKPFFKQSNYRCYLVFHKNYSKILFLDCRKQTSTKKRRKSRTKNRIEYTYNKKFLWNMYFLLRPLTILGRFKIKKLVQYFSLPLYPDTSNKKKKYYRNRIRKELLPTLKFFFNPQIHTSFLQFSEILINEQSYLNLLCKRLLAEFYIVRKTKFTLDLTVFQKLPLTIQKKLVKTLIKDCTNTKISFSNIDKITKLVGKQQQFDKKITIKNQIKTNFVNSSRLRRHTHFTFKSKQQRGKLLEAPLKKLTRLKKSKKKRRFFLVSSEAKVGRPFWKHDYKTFWPFADLVFSEAKTKKIWGPIGRFGAAKQKRRFFLRKPNPAKSLFVRSLPYKVKSEAGLGSRVLRTQVVPTFGPKSSEARPFFLSLAKQNLKKNGVSLGPKRRGPKKVSSLGPKRNQINHKRVSSLGFFYRKCLGFQKNQIKHNGFEESVFARPTRKPIGLLWAKKRSFFFTVASLETKIGRTQKIFELCFQRNLGLQKFWAQLAVSGQRSRNDVFFLGNPSFCNEVTKTSRLWQTENKERFFLLLGKHASSLNKKDQLCVRWLASFFYIILFDVSHQTCQPNKILFFFLYVVKQPWIT
uniref:tRNA(Ile)-lysidine synthase, chloroplastic n=1 Tax=Prasiolopsis wulf-kochii TaxID=3239232 RepID=A0A097KK36_9CHLO|nr:hypothetical chloroplast RF62 [Prasiolopsis sp. SAG 84.81]